MSRHARRRKAATQFAPIDLGHCGTSGKLCWARRSDARHHLRELKSRDARSAKAADLSPRAGLRPLARRPLAEGGGVIAAEPARLPRPRREPTQAELDEFTQRLGKWLADVAAKPRRAA